MGGVVASHDASPNAIALAISASWACSDASAAFAIPAGEFGTAPRDLLHGPGTWQIDLGTGKTFPLWERWQLEFRAEFYNVFNHPQLGQPPATCDVSSSVPAGCPSGFGSIINTVNLNTAIVNPITPVGSGTPREMQFALRFDF